MTDLIIYGASDDLIESEGLIRDEFNPPYDKPCVVAVFVDDAAYVRLHVEYDHDGEWRIQPLAAGDLVEVIRAPGERDDEPVTHDEHHCPCYSDKAVIDMRSIEARRVNIRIEAVA